MNGMASCWVLINPQRMRVHQLMLTWLIPKFVKKQDDFSTYHRRVTELRCTDAFTEVAENQRNLGGESHPTSQPRLVLGVFVWVLVVVSVRACASACGLPAFL